MIKLILVLSLIINFSVYTTICESDNYKNVENIFKIDEFKDIQVKYTNSNVKLCSKPVSNSYTSKELDIGFLVHCRPYNSTWSKVLLNGRTYYIENKFLSNSSVVKKSYIIPYNNGIKSWMNYKSITDIYSRQYKLQHNYAYTGNYGIRMIDNRYCIALGNYFNCQIGQYVKLILSNGTELNCIVSDIKDDNHTDSNHLFTKHNNCMSEFIVDDNLISSARITGNLSSINGWDGYVHKVIVYNKNILN